jgi:predicted glycoside hydrolase/deacetylase ChbG (UPF0249 family)
VRHGAADSVEEVTALAERLGHPPDAKLLIVTADDLGLCHSSNVGVFDVLHTGLVTSASLMVPCPWAREAAARYRGEDIGVHLSLTAEHPYYRWGPITHAPSLLGGDGGFPATMADFWEHADLDEVRRECRAQIERAILWGFDVSHLSAHMGTLQWRPEFFDVYLDLSLEFALPLRMAGRSVTDLLGFPAREVAAEAGVVFTDDTVEPTAVGSRELFEKHLPSLAPGVTEIRLHPAVDSGELRAIATDWEERVDDHRMVCGEETLRALVAAHGVVLVGYRALRELARVAA